MARSQPPEASSSLACAYNFSASCSADEPSPGVVPHPASRLRLASIPQAAERQFANDAGAAAVEGLEAPSHPSQAARPSDASADVVAQGSALAAETSETEGTAAGEGEGRRRGRNRRRGRKGRDRVEGQEGGQERPEPSQRLEGRVGGPGGRPPRPPLPPLPPLPDAGELFAEVVSGGFDTEPRHDPDPNADAQAPAGASPDAPPQVDILVTEDSVEITAPTLEKRVLLPEAEAPKLQKVLAQAGVGSRRDMEQLIQEGRITVNNQPAHVGQRISRGDQLRIDGRPVKIYARFEGAGLKVVAARMAHLSRGEAEAFYAVHKARPFFNDLVSFMISGPVMIQALEGEGAIAKNRELMGATDPKKADKGTIRADFADSIDANAVHGSDAPETAAVEVGFFFPGMNVYSR
ncbi:hypothetical protein B566_EDAN019125 [Ephemera danica]|nr:hypothetical protein B566_EDAN019125 [Ephemera danica]